jgi:hypothetical protein
LNKPADYEELLAQVTTRYSIAQQTANERQVEYAVNAINKNANGILSTNTSI